MKPQRSIIPNIITLGNAVCGVMAILLGDPVIGAYLIIGAMVLDLFDGLVARALKVEGELGKELDSMADLISFGVAPGYLFYHFFNNTEALVICMFYILSGLFRLAKFNTLSYSNVFNGLPIPAASGIAAGSILIYASDAVNLSDNMLIIAMIAPAICMNINMGFFSLKGAASFKDWRLWFVIFATIAAITLHWHYALLVCFASYLLVSFVSGLARNIGRVA